MRGFIGSLSVALLGAVAMAAEPTETITVTGSATVFVKPDAARIHYSVRVSDASADAAKDTATKQVATIAESVKGLKLDNLKTTAGTVTYSRSSIARMARGGGFAGPGGGGPGGPGGGGPIGLGPISAQIPLTATISEKEPDKLRVNVDSFIAKITEGGATVGADVDPDGPFVSSRAAMLAAADSARIDWFLTDESAARRDALRAAVRKAKGDAEVLGKELGWEKITIVSVTDGTSSARDVIDFPQSTPRAPAGEVAVTARVVIKCSR